MAGPPRQELSDTQLAALERLEAARDQRDAADLEFARALVHAKDVAGVTSQHIADRLGYPDRRNLTVPLKKARETVRSAEQD